MIDFDLGLRRGGTGAAAFTLDVHGTIADRAFVALVGPSGAGKTTLVRLLAGLERPERGHLVVDGAAWCDVARRAFVPARRRRAGVVFQDYALFPTMTVKEQLLYAAGRGERAFVDELLETMHLAGYADHRPDALSGGQKQRVALARALAVRPRLLLLDEPFAALDEALRVRLQDELRLFHDRLGLTTVCVTHDRAEVQRLADAVIALDHGRVVATGAPIEVCPLGG